MQYYQSSSKEAKEVKTEASSPVAIHIYQVCYAVVQAKLCIAQVIHNGIKLTDIYGSKSSPQKYARKVASHLFTKEELSKGICKKIGSTTREELSPGRCSVLRSKDV